MSPTTSGLSLKTCEWLGVDLSLSMKVLFLSWTAWQTSHSGLSAEEVSAQTAAGGGCYPNKQTRESPMLKFDIIIIIIIKSRT